MITCSYKTIEKIGLLSCSISGDRGKDANYSGKCYPALAPKKGFWKIWHNNIGKIPEKENNEYYIKEFYNQVLEPLDPEKVVSDLGAYALLCYEDSEEFCHRHIVAAWLDILLGYKVEEIKHGEKGIEFVSRPPYIKETLEKVMREKDMHGFHSLRARYLFEKGDKADAKASKLEEKNEVSDDACALRQYAAYMRSEADRVEDEYNQNKAKIKQKK